MKRGINNSSSATSRWGSMFGTKTTVTPRKNGDDQDDLLLFGEIHKQSEKERGNNLLQPISSDHDLLDYSVSDPNSGSNYLLYSAKKINGRELPMEGGKNDYDWLKTPPATPLFPSLEMEMDPEFVIQPLLTRFSVNNLESELNHRPKSPKTTKAVEIKEPSLLATPTNSSTTQPNSNGPNPASTSSCNNHNNYGFHDLTSRNISLKIYNTSDQDEKDSVLSANSRSNKYFPRQGIHDNLHRTPPNLTTTSSSSTRSSSAPRGKPNCNNVNPSTPKSSSINRQLQSSGYSSSLRSTSITKDRPSSASRGSRYNNNSTNNDNNPAKSSSADQDQRPRTITNTGSRYSSASKSRLNNINKLSSSTDKDRRLGNQQHSHVKPRRQSVSPSMTRGRNSISIHNHKQPEINNEQEQEHASTTILSSRGRIHRASGGSNNQSSHNVFGSKMVDKVMNARRSTTLSSVAVANQEREISHKHNVRGFPSSSLMINSEVSGFKKSSPSSSPSSVDAQNQDKGTMYEPKFESSTSSSSSPISNEKPSAGILKTSSGMALRNSKDTIEINHQATNSTRNVKNSTHDHSSIRRAIEQSRVCMNVEVIKLTTVTGDKKERRKFTVKGEK
ncbi:hypothetical protein MKW98_030560 [Papaver atlanticum]|uniref:Uncharacterized protein n=1 Tax=Papaver atlanticum TaxID=357466 RepID=A0AAD4XHC1_9MAGN|nr:hypothetical protein MKW98_030560 [Papaver atlanticum]